MAVPPPESTQLVDNVANATLEQLSLTVQLFTWTSDKVKSVVGSAGHYTPSTRDLAMAGPRMFMKLGSFAFNTVPDALDSAFGLRLGQHDIPGAEGIDAAAVVHTVADTVVQRGEELLAPDEVVGGFATRFSAESIRSFGNIFSYATSKWALCCVVMAILLNRTHVYASTRRSLKLSFKLRLALRILPIVFFAVQARTMLQSIQCQTSPDFSMLRWNNASKTSDLMFTYNGGLLHSLSSTLLLGASDADSCRAINMVPPEDAKRTDRTVELTGSLSRLWPLFETVCLSHFVETISCAVQGRPIAAETGMTLFEHSLAFAEADTAISAQLGWGPYGEKVESDDAKKRSGKADDTSPEVMIKRSMIMKKVNTSPEVLLVGFLSAMNHATSHILGVFNLQGRLRLVSTAFWGLCFMGIITYSLLTFSVDDLSSHSLLRFPTVCIIGFIPHVLVFSGILMCASIYTLALFLTALATPDEGAHSTFLRRLRNAHENLQANVQLPNLRISMQMDFYTALLKTGFSVLTMASEAVYLNESLEVSVKPMTWLEEERLREIEESGVQWLGPGFRTRDDDDGMAAGVGLSVKTQDGLRLPTNGFARERTAQAKSKNKSTDRIIRDGVGATERSGRWIMAFEFFLGIAQLFTRWSAVGVLSILSKMGVTWQPQLLLRLAQQLKTGENRDPQAKNGSDPLTFWLVDGDGVMSLPADNHVDVEVELRNRLQSDRPQWGEPDERTLDKTLYEWWLKGGWWGEDDNSGSFAPQEEFDDATSVISTTESEVDWESDEDYGQRTPTQRSPQPSRESTPLADMLLSAADLSRLLHPQTPEQRSEAHALAAHLSSEGIMTRSQYRRYDQRERARVLTSTRYRARPARSGPMSAEEEAEVLENLIRMRRGVHDDAAPGASWAAGAAGLGDGGPQCVVCHSAPRSIILWPCRCLSMCDDCRVTLAMQNYDKCPCCRRDVNSFSRIYVP